MDAIAITGIGCKLPGGVSSPNELWAKLLAGADLITDTPPDRWNLNAHYHSNRGAPGRTYSYWGGYVTNPSAFDAAFFGLTPREAAHMDPQQRWLLETSWEALEDAGVPPAKLAGSRTGVYIGISASDYGDIQKRGRYEVDMHTTSGSALSIASNRISYLLDLRGPSLSVDTACSSSLVALDLACQAMWRGELELALVGGANAILQSDVTVSFAKGGFLSPTGRCRPFDAAADGFVRAEGAVVVVLKPLSQALVNGDRIYALILSTLTNQDGRTGGLTVPSAEQQQAMLEQVYRHAGISAAQAGYIEAHGTGTAIGDPTEAAAIGKALGIEHSDSSPLWVGSVKSNLGHLEPASGVVGLIKLGLALHHRTIPPNVHFQTPNPRIPFNDYHVRVPTAATEWKSTGLDGRLYGGVNSFGFGGTNAHAVLCSAPVPVPQASRSITPPVVWTVSARSSTALTEAVKNDADFISTSGNDVFAETAAAVRRRRSHHPERIAVVADSVETAVKKLRAFAADGPAPARLFTSHARQQPPVALVFSGQGTQWPGMAHDLFQTNCRFRATFEELDAIMAPAWGRRLVEEIHRTDETIYQADIGQPVLFALQVGLYRLYSDWGIRPALVFGHSFGEVAAAYASGALDLAAAAKVIVERAKALELTRGAGVMAAIGMSEKEAQPLLAPYAGRLSIAAFNSPTDLTLAGDEDAIHAAVEAVRKHGRFARLLPLPYAFHSEAVESCREVFKRGIAGLPARRPAIPFVSAINATVMIEELPNDDYWWRNLRQPVQFAAATQRAVELGATVFLEIGPHPGLVRYLQQTIEYSQDTLILGSLRRNESGADCLADSLAALHCFGVTIDWTAFEPGSGRHVSFPKYPWQRQQYWSESEESRHLRLTPPTHPLLGIREPGAARRWEACISIDQFPYLGDHGFRNRAVLPAAGHIELMMAAASDGSFADPVALEDIHFDRIVWVDQPNIVHTTFDPTTKRIAVSARVIADAGAWEICSHGKRREVDTPNTTTAPRGGPKRPANAITVSPENIYSRFEHGGNHYGRLFRTVRQIWTKDGEAWAEVSLDPLLHAEVEHYYFHPALLDGVFHSALELIPIDDDRESLFVPLHMERIEWCRRGGSAVTCHIHNVHIHDLRWFADIDIFTPSGEWIATFTGCCCLKKPQEFHLAHTSTHVYQELWTPAPRPAPADNAPRVWLIVDPTEVAGELVPLLRANSEWVGHQTQGSDHLLSQFFENAGGEGAIVVFTALSENGRPPTAERVIEAIDPLLKTVQSLALRLDAAGTKTKLWLITAGATWGHPRATSPPNLLQSPAAGMLRTVANEFPNVTCRLLDFDHEVLGQHARLILDELMCGGTEDEIAYRDGERFTGQLVKVNLDTIPWRRLSLDQTSAFNYELRSIEPGSFDGLAWVQADVVSPAAHEIAIDVRAVGLNFRDVLKALDVYPLAPGETRSLGDECAGVVCGVGSDVTDFHVGDEVVAIAQHTFGNQVRTAAVLTAHKPKNLTFQEAATIPIAFLTADHSLRDIARLNKGESILIHAAAGGVGQAAVQIAKRIGAEIYATASVEKHEFLRNQGIRQIFNSRRLSFAADMRHALGDRGVDVVLNSLAGEFISRTLELLAPGGRFIEIGKKDIFQNSALNLNVFRNGASFTSIDLASVVARRPEWIGNRFRDLMKRFETGELTPLPCTTFTADKVVDAFRLMAQGKHRGKLVVTIDRETPAPTILAYKRPLVLAHASYLVTGGLSGLGFRTAQWLAEQGAKWLVLASRNGPKSDDTHLKLAQLKERGVEVEVISCDVTNSESVYRLIHQSASNRPPLRGVVHSALVLHDEQLTRVNRGSLAKVLSPKVDGAWNLHCATRDLRLDWFVMYSSVATIIGSPWQGSYVAANRFLDALAWYRKAEGLPAITVNWGPVADIGIVAENDALARYIESLGLTLVPATDVFQFLKFLLARDLTNPVVARIDWNKFHEHNSTARKSHRFAAALHLGMSRTSAVSGPTDTALQELLRLPPDAQPEFVLNHLRRELALVLRTDETSIDTSAALTTFGVDSLMAFEFKLRIDRNLKTELPIDQVSAGITLTQLANVLLRQLTTTRPIEPERASPEPAAPAKSTTEAAFLRVLPRSSARSWLDSLSFDAAALLYVPERVATVGGFSDDEVAAMFGIEPFISHLYETTFGDIGVITLPIRGAELFGSERVAGLVHDAGELARRHGARCISLTGLIPSATNSGRAVPAWLRSDTPRVTTGHATTTAAVLLNLEHLLNQAGRDVGTEHLAVVGLGSIGRSCLSLLLDVLSHPKSLTLCDVFGKRDELSAITQELRNRCGYRGSIHTLTTEGGVPDGVYEATTILAAVSVPEIIDVTRLRSGTIVVDDSYPPGFHLERAILRVEAHGDILFGNAGMVRLPQPIHETVLLPPGTEDAVARFGIESFRRELVREPHELTACILSSLLTDRYEGVRATIGLTEPADSRSHYRALKRLGITAARPQCGTYFVPDDAIRRFRSKFGMPGRYRTLSLDIG